VLAASKFAEQMRLLKTGGYRVVSLRDFTAWTRLQKQLPRNAVVLTFDDGYRSFLTYAYPVLKEYGFTATLFVPSAFVGAGRAALTWDELKSLASEGFDVEAHSKVHDYLLRKAKESDAAYAKRMAAEIDEPRDAFALHLGSAPALIAYPYGSADDAVLAKVRGAGYAEGFTVKRLSSPSFVDPFLIPRRQVYSEMSLKDFEKNLETFHAEKLSNPAAPTPRARDLAALVLNPADPAAFADLREAAKPAFIPPPPVLAPARSRANGAEPAAEAEPRIERAAPAAAAAPGPGAEAAPTAPPPEVSSGAAPAPPDR